MATATPRPSRAGCPSGERGAPPACRLPPAACTERARQRDARAGPAAARGQPHTRAPLQRGASSAGGVKCGCGWPAVSRVACAGAGRCERCKRAKKGAQYCLGAAPLTAPLRGSRVPEPATAPARPAPAPALAPAPAPVPCSSLGARGRGCDADGSLDAMATPDAGHHLSPGDPRPPKARRIGVISVPAGVFKKPRTDTPDRPDVSALRASSPRATLPRPALSSRLLCPGC